MLSFILIIDLITFVAASLLTAVRWYSFRRVDKCIVGVILQTVLAVEFSVYALIQNGFAKMYSMDFFLKDAVVTAVFLFTISTFVFSVVCLRKDYVTRKRILTVSSVREAIEKMGCGLLYSDTEGDFLMANHCMYEVTHRMFGEYFVNALHLWNRIISFENNEEIRRIDFTQGPAFLFSDKSVWSFEKTFLKDNDRQYIEIIARDVSALYRNRVDLEVENAKLSKVQLMLSESLKNVAETRQEEELLNYKMRVHDQLGNSVIRVRKLLGMEKIGKRELNEVLNVWQNTVSVFLTNRFQGEQELSGSIKEITDTAQSLGCEIDISGQLPFENELIPRIIREAMYNAVKHANATTLKVVGGKARDGYRIHIEDNGTVKPETVTEGGGLSSLRHSIEAEGGQMMIIIDDGLELNIILPYK